MFKYLIGAGGGAAVLSTYQAVEKSMSWKDSAQESAGNVASALGEMFGHAKASFQKSSHSAVPQPQITYIHTSDRGGPSTTTILVVGATGIAIYGGACYYFGWDFFGVSRRRAEAMMAVLNERVKQYSQRVQDEIDKLRGKIDESAAEQKKQAELLEQVNQTVKPYGEKLESIGLQNTDIAQALYCAQLNSEATAKGVMAINYLLIKLVDGSLHNREEALKVLRAALEEQLGALPANSAARHLLQDAGSRAQLQITECVTGSAEASDSERSLSSHDGSTRQVARRSAGPFRAPFQAFNNWWTGRGNGQPPQKAESSSAPSTWLPANDRVTDASSSSRPALTAADSYISAPSFSSVPFPLDADGGHRMSSMPSAPASRDSAQAGRQPLPSYQPLPSLREGAAGSGMAAHPSSSRAESPEDDMVYLYDGRPPASRGSQQRRNSSASEPRWF